MKISDIIPPADLLQQAEGIERGLRQYQRLGRFGWIAAAALSALELTLLFAPRGDPNISSLPTSPDAVLHLLESSLSSSFFLKIGIFLIFFFIIAAVWLRIRLAEAKEPFRYTCSVGDFVPGPSTDEDAKLAWLKLDLAERLSDRVHRLRFVRPPKEEDKAPPTKDEGGGDPHIHIWGTYIIREKRRGGDWFVEVLPRVRIGSRDGPDTLGHKVTFKLESAKPAPTGNKPYKPLSREEYDRVLERVYFSVATELYQQIQIDVQKKIDLLPSAYSQAVALYYEADDYASSKTLEGYENAGELYDRAAKLLDYRLRPLPRFFAWRFLARARRLVSGAVCRVMLTLAWALPRLGCGDLLCIRAQIGHATMLVYRRSVAQLSGQRVNPAFEAGAVSVTALERALRVPPTVKGQKECLVSAYVTRALVLTVMGAGPAARKCLHSAQQIDPSKVETDPTYLFARGWAEVDPTVKLDYLRRAVDVGSRFDVAAYHLGLALEEQWRRRPKLETALAREVLRAYDAVIEVNPGNLAAWGNRGFVQWLLHQSGGAGGEENGTDYLELAEREFESGSDYKSIKRDTAISELNYGLARIFAERGEVEDFVEAYRHATDAITERLSQGVSHNQLNYTSYYFAPMTRALIERFYAYKTAVLTRGNPLIDRAEGDPSKSVEGIPGRVIKVVCAFVQNDYGEACYNYYLQTGNDAYLREAEDAFAAARAQDETFVLAYYHLQVIDVAFKQAGMPRRPGHLQPEECLRQLEALAPHWADAGFAILRQKVVDAKNTSKELTEIRQERDRVLAVRNQKRQAYRVERLMMRVAQAAPVVSWIGRRVPPVAATTLSSMNLGLVALGTDQLVPAAGLAIRIFSEADSYLDANSRGQVASKSLQDEARRRLDAAEDIFNTAEEKFRRVQRLADEAWLDSDKLLKRLLPHTWLWKARVRSGSAFDWSAISNSSLAADGRWEQELTELHVNSLLEWGTASVDWDKTSNPDVWRLLRHLHARYLPGDLYLLLHLRIGRAEEDRDLRWRLPVVARFRPKSLTWGSYNNEIAALVDDGLVMDAGAWWTLTWIWDELVIALDSPDDVRAHPSFLSARRMVDEYSRLDKEKGRLFVVLYAADCLFDLAGYLACVAMESERKRERAGPSFADTPPRSKLEPLRQVVMRLLPAAEAPGPTSEARPSDAYAAAVRVLSQARVLEKEDPSFAKSLGLESSGTRSTSQTLLRAALLQCISRIATDAVEQVPDGMPPSTLASYEKAVTRDLDLLRRLGATSDVDRWLDMRERSLARKPENRAVWLDIQRARLVARQAELVDRQARNDQDRPPMASAAGTTAVGLRLGPGLWPRLGRSPDGGTSSVTPIMRPIQTAFDRIREATGVPVPAPWIGSYSSVRSTSVPDLRYFVSIGEAPVARGQIPIFPISGGGTGWWEPAGYCPRFRDYERALRGDTARMEWGVNPVTDTVDGVWVDDETASRLRGYGVDVWDLAEYVARHVEVAITPNLADLFGYGLVYRLLRQYDESQNGPGETTVRWLLDETPDGHTARLDFVRVLQSLVRDHVPIVDLPTILATFRDAWQSGADLTKLVESIREELQPGLRGIASGSPQIKLGRALEERLEIELARANGSHVLAVPGERSAELLDQVRSELRHSPQSSSVVVVDEPSLRPLVARVVATEFPGLRILAARDLLARVPGNPNNSPATEPSVTDTT